MPPPGMDGPETVVSLRSGNVEGRARTVRWMTARRTSPRVLCDENGSSLSADHIKHHVERVGRRLRMSENGVHRLRHTFCSHLAMRPARAIQELAGHRDPITTQRYMHLSAAVEGAIRLLDEGEVPSARGEERETADRQSAAGCTGRFSQLVDVHLRPTGYSGQPSLVILRVSCQP